MQRDPPLLYVLDGHTAVPASSTVVWAHWFERATDRQVALTHAHGVSVSTVFIGINLGPWTGQPVLFETCVFAAESSPQIMERYATWEEAEAGHADVCKRFGLMSNMRD